MGKKSNICYVGICLLLCAVPSVGMIGFKTDTTTENRTLAAFPEIKKENKWNWNYFEELGDYFNDHFAFRTGFVNLDSEIQSKVFRVSNVDTVLVGEEDWLYYTSTLDDYLGENTLSNRSIYNIVHNLEILEEYVESKGSKFLFTIPPNKNSLYGEHMPYYTKKKVSDQNNMTKLQPELADSSVPYADLFEPFQNSEELLYLKRDSHWNQKGAVLAYNTMLDVLALEHERYETMKAIRTKTEYGDLNKMLYPVTAKPEWNYQYDYDNRFTYVTNTESVEEAWIETENTEGKGTLLMFRDSFGNTLLPLMANQFNKAYFSKDMPYDIEKYMKEYEPDVVIAEKVERNMDEFAQKPPMLTGPVVELEEVAEHLNTGTTLEVNEAESNMSYWAITGELTKDCVQERSNVYIGITQEGKQTVYKAFNVTGNKSEYEYLLYMPKELIFGEVEFEVMVVNEEKITSVCSKTITIGE